MCYLLKLLYPGRFVRGSSSGMRGTSVSARAGSLMMACSQGEWYDFGTAVLLNRSAGMSFKGPPYPEENEQHRHLSRTFIIF